MRVTKLIKDYVTKTINEAIPTEHLHPEYERVRNLCEQGKEELNKKVLAYGNELAKRFVEENNIPADWNFRFSKSNYFFETAAWEAALTNENRKLSHAAEERRKKAIETVLLDMELGEINKQNLADAINKAIAE